MSNVTDAFLLSQEALNNLRQLTQLSVQRASGNIDQNTFINTLQTLQQRSAVIAEQEKAISPTSTDVGKIKNAVANFDWQTISTYPELQSIGLDIICHCVADRATLRAVVNGTSSLTKQLQNVANNAALSKSASGAMASLFVTTGLFTAGIGAVVGVALAGAASVSSASDAHVKAQAAENMLGSVADKLRSRNDTLGSNIYGLIVYDNFRNQDSTEHESALLHQMPKYSTETLTAARFVTMSFTLVAFCNELVTFYDNFTEEKWNQIKAAFEAKQQITNSDASNILTPLIIAAIAAIALFILIRAVI